MPVSPRWNEVQATFTPLNAVFRGEENVGTAVKKVADVLKPLLDEINSSR